MSDASGVEKDTLSHPATTLSQKCLESCGQETPKHKLSPHVARGVAWETRFQSKWRPSLGCHSLRFAEGPGSHQVSSSDC